MASGYSDYRACEMVDDARVAHCSGSAVEYVGEHSSSANNIPRFRRGYSRYPMQNGGFNRRINYNNQGYHDSRHGYNRNMDANRDYYLFNNSNNIVEPAASMNSLHNSFPNHTAPSRSHSKRYSQNRGLVENGSQDNYSGSTNGVLNVQENNVDQNNVDLESQKTKNRKWNHRGRQDYLSNKRGKGRGNDSWSVTQDQEVRREEPSAHREQFYDRNANSSNLTLNDNRTENTRPQDGLFARNNLRHYGRGGRGRWSHNEGQKNFQPQSKNVEKSEVRRNSLKAFQRKFEARDKPDESKQFENKKDDCVEEKTFENQRELLEDQLRSNSCECLVCCSRVGKGSPIWSCSTCFNIFHLSCIKKWALSSAVDCPMEAVEVIGDKKFWRCPTCQNTSSEVPDQYLCFCGKQRNPQFSFEMPHSCGEVCSKKRGNHCRHPCNVLCHPGPCPPCLAMVHTSCGCGKRSSYVMCNSSVDLKCEETCEKMLNCGNHTCLEVCHKGVCHPCLVEVELTCHCGKTNRSVPCGSKESFSTSYSCMKKCEKLLDCGNHSCPKICHLRECDPCLLRPELIKSCACGKSDVDALELLQSERQASLKPEAGTSEVPSNKKSKKKKKKNNVEEVPEEEESPEESKWPRTSCLDPLPSCSQVCGKELQCGTEDDRHHCKRKCHNGPCQSCRGMSKVQCQCKNSVIDIHCKELANKKLQNQPVKCSKRCTTKLSCGRHKCNANCCVDQDHLCRKICKRNLTCGLHQCEEPCHPGNCDRCWFTSFEELTCRCGAEVIYPPISCGTKRPTCQRTCTREHACNHPVRHTCHDEPGCPPCVHLTEKMCMCGKELRKNVPCHLQDVRCGSICGKVLPCGSHFCQKFCHKGPCLDANGPKCIQPCQLSRESCGHPCLAPCHMDEPCPKTKCVAKVQVTCECGRKEGMVPCTKESINSFNNAITSRFCLSKQSDPSPPNSNNKLQCDKECAVYKRQKQLAEAFQIKEPNLSPDAVGCVQPNYSDFLKDFAKRNAFFVSQIEHDLQQLVKSTATLEKNFKCHSFKIMKREQRRVVHELAESYGVDTESQDEEPYRNVVAKATKNKCFLPSSYLALTSSTSITPRSVIPPSLNSARPPTIPAPPTASAQATLKRETQPAPKPRSTPAIDYFDYEG